MWTHDSVHSSTSTGRRSEIALRTSRRDEPWPETRGRRYQQNRGQVVRSGKKRASSVSRGCSSACDAPHGKPAPRTEPRVGTAVFACSRAVNRKFCIFVRSSSSPPLIRYKRCQPGMVRRMRTNIAIAVIEIPDDCNRRRPKWQQGVTRRARSPGYMGNRLSDLAREEDVVIHLGRWDSQFQFHDRQRQDDQCVLFGNVRHLLDTRQI